MPLIYLPSIINIDRTQGRKTQISDLGQNIFTSKQDLFTHNLEGSNFDKHFVIENTTGLSDNALQSFYASGKSLSFYNNYLPDFDPAQINERTVSFDLVERSQGGGLGVEIGRQTVQANIKYDFTFEEKNYTTAENLESQITPIINPIITQQVLNQTNGIATTIESNVNTAIQPKLDSKANKLDLDNKYADLNGRKLEKTDLDIEVIPIKQTIQSNKEQITQIDKDIQDNKEQMSKIDKDVKDNKTQTDKDVKDTKEKLSKDIQDNSVDNYEVVCEKSTLDFGGGKKVEISNNCNNKLKTDKKDKKGVRLLKNKSIKDGSRLLSDEVSKQVNPSYISVESALSSSIEKTTSKMINDKTQPTDIINGFTSVLVGAYALYKLAKCCRRKFNKKKLEPKVSPLRVDLNNDEVPEKYKIEQETQHLNIDKLQFNTHQCQTCGNKNDNEKVENKIEIAINREKVEFNAL